MKFLSYWKYFSPLLLFIPVNIYVIGNYLGAGISFPLFKLQISYMGTMIFSIITELTYVLNGTYHHNTAISIISWTSASILLIIAICLVIFSKKKLLLGGRIAGSLLMLSTLLFLIAIIFQYGPLFHGPAGTAIPIGLPVLFVIGGWMYMEGQKEEARDEEYEEVQEIGEGSE